MELSSVVKPVQNMPATPAPARWPIAAAMLQFPATLPDGRSVQDAPESWVSALSEVAEAGFDCVDPTDSWLRLADLSSGRLTDFADIAAAAGLAVPSISSARRSVIDARHGEEFLAYAHRLIDAAAEIGAGVVSTGFFQALTPAQRDALWFWTAPGHVDADDPQLWLLAVERIRDLGRHAASVGVRLSLEMYEDTFLGTADSAVRFVTDVDLPGVGLNPDLGNLIRMHRPVEHWESMAAKVLPYANFWHVKN
jgi:sugar phosphate isomerase/epimerase